MSPGREFFAIPSVRRILERASRSAGVPLSVHPFAGNREEPAVASWGRCAACEHVNGTAVGERACRQSRRSGSLLAVGQQSPHAYPCHLGLGVVAVTAKLVPGFVLTFGPYCPAAEVRGLETSVREGLSDLFGEDSAEVPFSLDDIHRTPRGAVSAVAEWTVEALDREAERLCSLSADPEPGGRVQERPAAVKPQPKAGPRPVHEEIAVALAGGVQGPLRAHLRSVIAETGARATPARRGGAVSIAVSRLLESCHAAGADLSEAWTAFAAFANEAPMLETERALVDAAVHVLTAAVWPGGPEGRGRRATAVPAPPVARLNDAELNRILLPRFADGISLTEVAALLNVSPSAVTHRLQRRFGLSYSEYLGRLRAEKAKELLRRTRLTVGEVAQRVGVSDPSNLGRLFRRHVGMSPSEYRLRHGRKP